MARRQPTHSELIKVHVHTMHNRYAFEAVQCSICSGHINQELVNHLVGSCININRAVVRIRPCTSPKPTSRQESSEALEG